MKKVNVKIEEGVKTLSILEGKALEPKDPVAVKINGNIDCAASYLTKRKDNISILKSHLIINRDNRIISLIVNESDYYSDTITGKLELSTDFTKYQINSGKRLTTFDMAELIRMNRTCFESKETAMKLVTDLRKFKAKIDKHIEASDDKRANTTLVRTQAVESNIPEAFTLHIPIFKGFKPEKIEVEIDIDPTSLECSMVSPMANDIIKQTSNGLIDEQVEAIKNLVPDLVIFEV